MIPTVLPMHCACKTEVGYRFRKNLTLASDCYTFVSDLLVGDQIYEQQVFGTGLEQLLRDFAFKILTHH